MLATTLGDFGSNAGEALAIDQDAASQQPPLHFSPFVKADHLQKCYNVARSEPIARRALRYKLAKLFYRITVNKHSIEGGDMAGGENLALAVTITWGIERRPVKPEFTNMIIAFMMEAVVAKAMYGGIPWYEYKEVSRFETPIVLPNGNQKSVRYRVPCVAACGLFRIAQRLDPANMQRIEYAFESTQVQSGRAPHPGGTQSKSFAQTTNYEIDGLQRGALAAIGGSTEEARRRALGRSKTGTRSNKHGMYFFPTEKPDIDGTLASAAATVLAINEFVEMMKACKITADSLGANPMLVTQHASQSSVGGIAGGVSAAQHLLTIGDLSNKRAVDQMNDDQREAIRQQQHDRVRSMSVYASQVQAARTTITDMLTRRNRRLTQRAFYDAHHYDVPAGQQVASQPMPIAPGDVPAWEEARQDMVAAAFDTSRSILLGESSNVKAGAELNRDVETQSIEFEANQLAAATQDILNTIYAQRETKELRAMHTLLSMKEDLTDEQGTEMERLQHDIEHKERYHVSFAPAVRSSIDDILKVAQRGLLPREIEAALLAHSIGIAPTDMELQAFPNPYERPPDPLAAAAISAGQPGPKSTPKSDSAKK